MRIYGPISSLGLLVRGDSTRNWAAAERDAIVDLDHATLSGVGPGDPVNALSWLGPADENTLMITTGTGMIRFISWAFGIHRILHFRSAGITILVEGPRLIESLHFDFGGEDQFVPFSGTFKRNGQSISLSADLRSADVRRVLGPPDVVEDYEEPCPNWPNYVYYAHGRTIEFAFAEDGSLRTLSISQDCRYNPTRGLVRDPNVALVADLDKGALCGVGIGEPFKKLSFLGPASDCTFIGCVMCDSDTGKCKEEPEDTIYLYKHLGLEVHADNKDTNNSLGIRVEVDENKPGAAFPGSVVFDGKNLDVHEFETRTDVNNLLGPPDHSTEGEPHSECHWIQWHRHGENVISAMFGSGEKTEEISWSTTRHIAPNPTKSWGRSSELALVADWNECSLCGVRLGEPLERLKALGPANQVTGQTEESDSRDRTYSHKAPGTQWLYFGRYRLSVCKDSNEAIVAFDFSVSSRAEGYLPAWSGKLRRAGIELPALDSLGTQRIVGLFGKPDRITYRRRFGVRTKVNWYIYAGDHADRLFGFDRDGTVGRVVFAARVK